MQGVLKVVRQLRAENLAAFYAKLQETRTVPVHISPVVSHSENSKVMLAVQLKLKKMKIPFRDIRQVRNSRNN